MVKNPHANAGDIREVDLIPGSRRFPGGGHGNPFQYSCLQNSVDRGAWQAITHRVAKSWIRLKQLSVQGPTIKHTDLYSVLCNGLYGTEKNLKKKKA